MTREEGIQQFESVFQTTPTHLFTAAGRINVIGEHVDYCGGQVFPAALNLRCNLYARTNGKNCLNLAFRGLDGWSSLVALMVITMIDEEYEVTITGDEMKKQNTIGELYNLVASKL